MDNLSDLIRMLMKESDMSQIDAARLINKKVNIFRNKLYRKTFSLEDIVIIGKACGYQLNLCNGKNNYDITEILGNTIQLNDSIEYFKNRYDYKLKNLDNVPEEIIIKYLKERKK